MRVGFSFERFFAEGRNLKLDIQQMFEGRPVEVVLLDRAVLGHKICHIQPVRSTRSRPPKPELLSRRQVSSVDWSCNQNLQQKIGYEVLRFSFFSSVTCRCQLVTT
jgi:hypothetical protein